MIAQATEILHQALAWRSVGHGVALATVIETWGSSPRPIGSLMAINDRGAFVGSVSGGCIESAVISEAIDVIAEGNPQAMEYGITDERAHEIRLSCGGNIRILIEPAPEPSELERMIHNQPIARVVDLDSGNSSLVTEQIADGPLTLDTDKLSDVSRLLTQEINSLQRYGKEEYFVSVHTPPPKLVIIGAVHIAQSLVPMARDVGFSVSVIDPRPRFATKERFPDTSIITKTVEKAMLEMVIDKRTALVTLGHDPLLDDPALKAFLASPAYYIGSLGSRRTHAERLKRLSKDGICDAHLARVHGPIGLDIGGRSPSEIAISILAEIIAVGNDRYSKI